MSMGSLETRPIIALLEPKWRQSDVQSTQTIKCVVPCRWAETADVKIAVSVYHRYALFIHLRLHSGGVRQGRIFATPSERLSTNVSRDSCKSAPALLVCLVSLGDQAGAEWPRGTCIEMDKVHECSTFKSLTQLVERIRNIDGQFNEWRACSDRNGDRT